MKIYKEGDTGKALCETCEGLVDTIYQVRDLPLSDGSGEAKDVLAIVCSSCDTVCGIPHQSLPLVQKAVSESKRQAVESRVPVQVDDILNVACQKLAALPDFRSSLVRYYAKKLATGAFPVEQLKTLLGDDVVTGRSIRRVSVKGGTVRSDFEVIKAATHLSSTDCLKAITVKIKDDIVDGHNEQALNELQTIVAIS